MRRFGSALLAFAFALAGCGGEDAPAGITLSISRDFGTRPVAELHAPRTGADETPLSLLRGHARVAVDGGEVLSVDGLRVAGGARPASWFVYVNGFGVGGAPASARVHDGDHVWWDRHDARGANAVRAVVGAFPEPFLHGIEGNRLPVRVECAEANSAPCEEVAERMAVLGIPAARGVLRGARMQNTLRILVGPWSAIRGDEALAQLERGPSVSGVYALPAADGRSIASLDASGETARSFGPGTGLVVATRFRDEQPVWAVTGTDDRGVAAAARAFREGTLRHRFAVLIDADLPVALPESG